jgi:nucleotide-binding universal stress UspA family protein
MRRALAGPAMFNKIMVGYDGSESSRKALQTALELGRLDSSPVLAVAVVRPPEFAELQGEVQDAIQHEVKGPLAVAFQWARHQAGRAEVHLTLWVRVGHPADTLVRIAEEEGCGLIVLGRRGLTPVQRWVLGSVSERVLRYAHCAVMVVH